MNRRRFCLQKEKGDAPVPAGGAYDAPPDPLVWMITLDDDIMIWWDDEDSMMRYAEDDVD